jgi:hypothetical protein
MLIWLASYPKSGNTLVRSLLTSYYFSKDGNLEFKLLKNITQFPTNTLLNNLGFKVKNNKEDFKNYIKAQKLLSKKGSTRFLKTHSSLFEIDNIPFTDLDCSLGVIYIIRDPRNVVSSFASHFQISLKEASNRMINAHHIGTKFEESGIQYTGSWSFNFNSWKSFEIQNRYLLIKYENLINDTEEILLEILNFINKLNNNNARINKKKLSNSVKSCSFEEMKKKEILEGFHEATTNKKTGKKINFFRLGKKNDYKDSLDLNIRKELESSFQKEMKELGYL